MLQHSNRLLSFVPLFAMALSATVIAKSSQGIGQPSAAATEMARVTKVEREFARASMTIGIKQSFLQYAAPDAVIFRPRPVPAVATLQKDPDDNWGATLDW